MKTRRLFLPLLIVGALLALAIGSPSSASAKLPKLGIADNNLSTLNDPRFQNMGIRALRVTIPWNAYLKPNSGLARRFNRVIDTAQQRGIQVIASFTLGNFKSKRKRGALIGVKSYTKMFKRFRKRQRDVRQIIPWNEVNHRFMPTHTKRGAFRAAQYYKIVKKRCRGCTVLGATVLDLPNVVTWLKRFKRALRTLRVKRPRIWGLHAYKGVERGRGSTKPVRTVLRNVPGQVWIVESGGLFKHSGRKPKVRPNAQRQARQDRFLFNRIANGRGVFRRIKRIYIYNWAQTGRNTWDSALIGPSGYSAGSGFNRPNGPFILRPAFFVVQGEAQKRGMLQGPPLQP